MIQKDIAFIKQLAIESGTILKDMQKTAAVFQKPGDGNVVTEADYASEKHIIAAIRKHFPLDEILSEESLNDYSHALEKERLWVIDPLDGTNNYAYGRPFANVSIGYVEKGQVMLGAVYNPFTDELYTAARGKGAFLNDKKIKIPVRSRDHHLIVATDMSYDPTLTTQNFNLFLKIKPTPFPMMCAAAANEICWVASGKIDVYFHSDLRPWDNAAGFLVVEEAGGVIRDHFNKPAPFIEKAVIVGSPDNVTNISNQFNV